MIAVMGVVAIARSKITVRGQVAVPAAIRRRLGIGPGSILEWDEESGRVVVRRARTFTSEEVHQAVFATGPKANSLKELKAGIGKEMKRRHAVR